MAGSKPKLEGVMIVLVGAFNPQIFQPAWFASEKLIRKEEADSARIEIIHGDLTVFSLDWCKLEVTDDRFRIDTSSLQQYSPELIRDLTLGTFGILRHTPLKMMGLNTMYHFEVASEEVWHSI